MIRWTDVSEKDWYFNEVMEASNYMMEDGTPFVAGIPYGVFEDGAPYIYEEHNGGGGKKIFNADHKLTPTSDNPLFVFVDGVQTMYKDCRPNSTGTSDVELYVGTDLGQIISFVMPGKVAIDETSKGPIWPGDASLYKYPNHLLDNGSTYYYNPLSAQYLEYLYAAGRTLKRINVPDEEWAQASDPQDVARKYIGYQQDVYIVSPAPTATIYLPYNLNNMTLRFVYNSYENGQIKMRGGNFKAYQEHVWHNDRFFPDTFVNRAQAVVFLEKLIQSFYSRFTDQEAPTLNATDTFTAYDGQRVIPLNFTYPLDQQALTVTLNGSPQQVGVHFTEFDNHTLLWNTPLPLGSTVTVTYPKNKSIRFADLGVDRYIYNRDTDTFIKRNGTDDYFVNSALLYEDLQLNNGDYLINGMMLNNFTSGYAADGTYVDVAPVLDKYNDPIMLSSYSYSETWLMPYTPLTRAEAVALLNRFRKWALERFKGGVTHTPQNS